MSKLSNEWLMVGGTFLLGPIVGCAAGMGLFYLTNSFMLGIIGGTVFGMALYVLGCVIHGKHRAQPAESTTHEA